MPPLPQAWVGLRGRCRSACSTGSDIPAELPHKHKHRMRLAGLSAFSSPSEENQGKLLPKLHGPSKTMGGTKFSCEPRQGAGFTTWGCLFRVGSSEREQCPVWGRVQARPTAQAPGPSGFGGGGLWLWGGWAPSSENR